MNNSSLSNINSQYQDNNPDEQRPPIKKRAPKVVKSIISFLKKYWYLVIIAILLVSFLVTFFIIKTNQEASWKRAIGYFEEANYKKAEKELIGLDIPSDEDRIRVYAQTMLATQHLEKSLEAYQKLYAINKDPSVKLIMGNIYNQKKEYDKAVKIYEEIISNNSGNIQAYVNLATVYRLQGKNEKSVTIAKKGVSNNPSSIVLGELLVSMLMDDTESANYKMAISSLKKLDPANPLIQSLGQ